MAHLWLHFSSGWAVFALTADAYRLDPQAEPLARPLDARARRAPQVILRRAGIPDAPPAWVLLAAPLAGAWTNDQPLALGARVLRDRDEIRLPGASAFYFSTETLAEVAAFPGATGDGPVNCPRCQQAIEPGSPAVRCPACDLWYHQTAEFPCWTYSEHCARCPQPTALDIGYRWSPEEAAS